MPFIESLESPVIVANIDDSLEHRFGGKYQKSIVIDRYDRKIGVIGVIWSKTNVSNREYSKQTTHFNFYRPCD